MLRSWIAASWAIEAFAFTGCDGVPRVVTPGTLMAVDDPDYKGREALFEVETAAARPRIAAMQPILMLTSDHAGDARRPSQPTSWRSRSTRVPAADEHHRQPSRLVRWSPNAPTLFRGRTCGPGLTRMSKWPTGAATLTKLPRRTFRELPLRRIYGEGQLGEAREQAFKQLEDEWAELRDELITQRDLYGDLKAARGLHGGSADENAQTFQQRQLHFRGGGHHR